MFSKGTMLIQNGSTSNVSNIKYAHQRKFKLNELKSIPFSLSKYLKKLKDKAVVYPGDTEKFCRNDQNYINTINNSILKTKILETIQNQPKKMGHSYRQQNYSKLISC